jgi:hypothetical protein
MNNSELQDAIMYAHSAVKIAAPNSPVFPHLIKHHLALMDEQRKRAAQGGREAEREASAFDPCTVLWQAMLEAERFGSRTDDKLIVDFLRIAGYCIAPIKEQA